MATDPGRNDQVFLGGALRVVGNDAPALLQRLLAGDLRRLRPGTAQLGCCCSAQGRVLADFYLWHSGTGFLLLPPPEMGEVLQQYLAARVLRDEVRVEAHTGYRWSAWEGPGTPALLAAGRNERAPARPYEGWERAGELLLRVPGTTPRFLYAAADHRPPPSPGPEHAARSLSPEQWARLDIAAGVPWIGPGLSGRFLPQALNLDRLGALHLDKGCFPGQEVISRLHYRGVLKRRLHRVQAPCALRPGLELLDPAGRTAGQVLNGVPTGEGGHWIGLAVAKIGSARLRSADSPSMLLQLETVVPLDAAPGAAP